MHSDGEDKEKILNIYFLHFKIVVVRIEEGFLCCWAVRCDLAVLSAVHGVGFSNSPSIWAVLGIPSQAKITSRPN